MGDSAESLTDTPTGPATTTQSSSEMPTSSGAPPVTPTASGQQAPVSGPAQSTNGAASATAPVTSDGNGQGGTTSSTEPAKFFWIAFLYTLLLLAIFVVYQVSAGFRNALPGSIGPLPVGVPWFGAIGGAMISLAGTIGYTRHWNHDYDYWHYVRPWVGSLIGSMGALILIVLIQLSTTTTPKLDHLALYVVAFIVGYREQSFRDLIKRATDLLLAPGQSANQSAQQLPRSTS